MIVSTTGTRRNSAFQLYNDNSSIQVCQFLTFDKLNNVESQHIQDFCSWNYIAVS